MIGDMKRSKFLPEIQRNRLYTNWVLKRDVPGGTVVANHPRPRWSSKGLLMFLALFVVASIALFLNVFPANPRGANSITRNNPTAPAAEQKPETPCSEGHIHREARAYADSLEPPTSFEGFQTETVQRLGGVVTVHLKCESQDQLTRFQVSLEYRDARWELERISQPPAR
jgi:hypothetical protein